MIVCIADVLGAEQVERIAAAIVPAGTEDGRKTAGWHARTVKNNRQLSAAAAAPLRKIVTDALQGNGTVRAAAQPRAFSPVLFSAYTAGMSYGAHVDDAIMRGGGLLRSDVSYTVFLAPPDSYEGGALIIETTAGEQRYKLPAGAAILYPATTLHRVEPVVRGERKVAVGWIQSLIREAERREILFDLDLARRAIFARDGKSPEFDRIAKTYANLMRMWADV